MKNFNDLKNLLIEHGFKQNENVSIEISNNQISVIDKGNLLKKGEECMKIHASLLPEIKDYTFGLKDNKITCKAKDSTKVLKNKIMMYMISIYNETEKISFHKKSSIYYALRKNRELLEYLLKYKPPKKTLLELLDKKDYDQLLIKTFLSNREFNLMNKNKKLKKVLMPMIDYFNHTSLAYPFQYNNSTQELSVNAFKLNNSKELFVKYKKCDALDTLIEYGFVDISSPFIFSIPLEFKLYNGFTILFNNVPSDFKGELPKSYQHLHNIIPHIIKEENNKLILSRIAIPNSTYPFSLRLVLNMYLKPFIKTTDEMSSLIKEIEKSIINNNINYYKNLEKLRKKTKLNSYINEQLKSLSKHYLTHLKNYGDWFNE